MTPLEEKVLAVIYPTAISGNSCVNEAHIEFIFENEENLMEVVTRNSVMQNCKPKGVEDKEFAEALCENNTSNKQKLVDVKLLKQKRSIAANRLLTSAKATTTLADLSKERLDFQKGQSEKKFEFEKQYRERKLVILERQAKAIEDLVNTMRKK